MGFTYLGDPIDNSELLHGYLKPVSLGTVGIFVKISKCKLVL